MSERGAEKAVAHDAASVAVLELQKDSCVRLASDAALTKQFRPHRERAGFFGSLAAFVDARVLLPTVYPKRRPEPPVGPVRAFPPMPHLTGDSFAPPPPATFDRDDHRVRFESSAWPLVGEVTDELLARRRNRIVPLRLGGPVRGRSVVLGVHGYLGGGWMTDRVALAAARFERAGYTFSHLTLPFHGARKERRERPFFPHPDPRITFESLRQGALDVVTSVGVLRELGARRVLLAGLSLGAYVAALAATIAEGLDGLVLLTPLASFRAFDATPAGDARDLLTLTRASSRPSRLPGSAVLVVGARHDRLTPPEHARHLADSFKGELALVDGGHLLPFGRDPVLDRWLAAR